MHEALGSIMEMERKEGGKRKVGQGEGKKNLSNTVIHTFLSSTSIYHTKPGRGNPEKQISLINSFRNLRRPWKYLHVHI